MVCKTPGCGQPTEFDWEGYPEEYCGHCVDRMEERRRKQAEWDHYHPDAIGYDEGEG